MRYAAVYKTDSEPLDRFIQAEGWYQCVCRSFRAAGARRGKGIRDAVGEVIEFVKKIAFLNKLAGSLFITQSGVRQEAGKE
jgi:hypothetical protein